MWQVEVTILRWVSDDFPGWVECELTDASGRRWLIHEKEPVFSATSIPADGLPFLGFIGCVLTSSPDGDVVGIDTDQPWGIASVEGETRFSVPRQLLSQR